VRDTIYALATAPGRAAVAIVRVSGPQSLGMLKALCGAVPAPRRAALREIRDDEGGLIDQGVVLWFPGPHSFTGEDVFELQIHGGPAIIEAVTRAIDALGGRLAEPGEFTRRAFEAGRLDLAQAEAVADLVDAETDAQRRQALRQLGGALFQRGERWREALVSALAFLNAQIDFPDEDLPADVAAQALAPLETLVAEIEAALSDVRGERIREGLRIALIGAPNAGKSSLFNALVQRDAAIVAATPGTTRDVIEAPLSLLGFKVLLADTAGLRAAVDEVEVEGVRRATAWADSADLRLWVVDPTAPEPDDQFSALIKSSDILVLTKRDLVPAPEPIEDFHRMAMKMVRTSVVQKGGLDELSENLERWVAASLSGSDFPAVTRIRHRRLLQDARDHLQRALSQTIDRAEVIAADVRLAMFSLESIAGRLDTEAILDRVFATFCIGK
jgi:tRNA modification GTPase